MIYENLKKTILKYLRHRKILNIFSAIYQTYFMFNKDKRIRMIYKN